MHAADIVRQSVEPGFHSAAPWLTIVGIGEDGVAGLSPRAVNEIGRATLVVGGRRHLELATPLITGDTLAWVSPVENTFPALLARSGRPTCVLASGDPFHFGIGATLSRLVPADEMVCIPHISAFSLAAARLGWPLQDCTCLSLHGRSLDRILVALQPRRRALALSWDRTTPGRLAELLRARGYGPTRMIVCEAMGGGAERLRSTTAAGFDLDEGADLNTVALEVSAEPGARVRPFTPGLADDWFEHDGQITKSPVRAVTLAALAPRHGERLWDIGSGSGSVSVEWLLADPSTFAVAIDVRADRRARTVRNAAQWGVSERLTPVEGEAPACLAGLSPPDAIFVGGGVTAAGMLERCMAALPPGGRLVANTVTLESQGVLGDALRRFGGEILTLAIATAELVGGFHGLRPAMPVMQWRWTKS